MIGERQNVFRISVTKFTIPYNVKQRRACIDLNLGMKGTPRRKYQRRPVVIEPARTGRKKRGGRSEAQYSNERGGELGTGRKIWPV